VLVGIAVALFASLLALRFSGLVQRLVRPTGVLLLARVAGMILAAIAVQMIADAVTELVKVGSESM
jgi:multiple antibiotic resistance protein